MSRRPAAIALAAAGTLLLGWLVVRVTAAAALLEIAPEAAYRASPDHPPARLAEAHDELRLSGTLRDDTRRGAERAFERLPLSEVPLLAGARAALARGEEERADALLAAALRRNPRSRYGLLLSLERDVRLGRDAEAARTMAVLARLFNDVGSALVGQIASMARDPATRAAARHVMASDAAVREGVLAELAREAADPELVLELAGPVRPATAGGTAPRWQQLLLDALVERGRIAQARSVWARLTGVDPAATPVYDPGFTGLPGLPPFNWRYESSADGYAEPVRGAGGLTVEYYGRAPVRLASQLLALPPGRYEIAFEAEGQAAGEDSRLVWTLSCHPDETRLAELPITGVEFTAKRFAAAFTVPAGGCAAQWLRLAGTSAEFPKAQQATIRGLSIARGGS